MKKHFLIDFENVADEGLRGFFELDPADTVDIIYTENAARIGIEFTEGCLKAEQKATLNFMKVPAGRQALDMQLATYLGSLIATDTEHETEYVIVSKDKGFMVIRQFWADRMPEIPVRIQRTIRPEQQQGQQQSERRDQRNRGDRHGFVKAPVVPQEASSETVDAEAQEAAADSIAVAASAEAGVLVKTDDVAVEGRETGAVTGIQTDSTDAVQSSAEQSEEAASGDITAPENTPDGISGDLSEDEKSLSGSDEEPASAASAEATVEPESKSAGDGKKRTRRGGKNSRQQGRAGKARTEQSEKSADNADKTVDSQESTAAPESAAEQSDNTAPDGIEQPKQQKQQKQPKQAKQAQSKQKAQNQKKQPAKPEEPADRIAHTVQKHGLDESVAGFVSGLTAASKDASAPLKDIYQGTVKKYGQKKGLEIYNLLKSEIKQLLKTV